MSKTAENNQRNEFYITSSELCEKLNIQKAALKSRMYRARQSNDNFFESYYKKMDNFLLWNENAEQAIKDRELEIEEMKKRNLMSHETNKGKKRNRKSKKAKKE
jgi:hypothetical protein